jgi:hypothetical protein
MIAESRRGRWVRYMQMHAASNGMQTMPAGHEPALVAVAA